MAKTQKTDRKNCQQCQSSILLSPSSPRTSKTIVETLRRVRLLRDTRLTAGKLPHRELFKSQNVAEATDYQILKSQSSC